MKKNTTEAAVAASTVAVFVLALVGAGYAVYTLIPPLVADPESRRLFRNGLLIFAAALLVVILAFRSKRN